MDLIKAMQAEYVRCKLIGIPIRGGGLNWPAQALESMESRRVSNIWTRFFWYVFRFLGDASVARLAAAVGSRR